MRKLFTEISTQKYKTSKFLVKTVVFFHEKNERTKDAGHSI